MTDRPRPDRLDRPDDRPDTPRGGIEVASNRRRNARIFHADGTVEDASTTTSVVARVEAADGSITYRQPTRRELVEAMKVQTVVGRPDRMRPTRTKT